MTGSEGRPLAFEANPGQVAAQRRLVAPGVPAGTHCGASTRHTGTGRALIASLVLALAGASIAAEPVATPPAAPAAGRTVSRRLAFEANRGQLDAQVQFMARGATYTAFLTSSEVVLSLGNRRAALRLKPIGANGAARVVGNGALPGVVNYVRGDSLESHISAPTYRRVRYVDAYPGIDLVYYSRAGGLEYDFVVAPGADPSRIGLGIDGAERVEVDGEGTLVVHTAAGAVRQPRPVAYQRIGGVRRPVAADYALDAEGRVRLRLGAYDRSRRLVIDPVITYATYLGGTGDEARIYFEGEVRLARDGAGNLYVTGTTRSTDFPTTAGAYRTLGGGADLFVTKLSPGGAVLYSTYLGGPCEDYARDIAVDGAGNAYVTGDVNGGGTCVSTPGVLVAKLDANGNLVYASRLGGSLVDSSYGTGIAVDGAGHAYVTGVALTSDFPTTSGAYRTAACPNVYPFAGDGFVAKLSADGSTLLYSTLLCGQGDDSPSGIAIDAAGNAYVAGSTASSDFPLVDPIELSRGGGSVGLSGFVAKLSADGSALLYSTYLGGSGSAVINAIALDAAGNAYVTGETSSVDFPTTPGVLQERPGKRHCIAGCTDAFVTKIAPSGSALVYSTYLYGELDDAGNAIAVDGAGNAYVVGQTVSNYFPIVDAFQSNDRGLDDAFVVELNPDATRLVYSSYLGGSRSGRSPSTGSDTGTAIVLDTAGTAYVAGYTQSFDLPTTPDAFQPNLAGGICDVQETACGDGFVVKISAGGPGVTPAVNLTVDRTAVAPGGTLIAAWSGNPTPSASDYLRLFALGSAGDDFDDVVIGWSTPGAAAGQLPLLLPTDLPAGWYELRLLSPAPGSSLAVPIARSEPIRIGGPIASTSTSSTSSTSSSSPSPTSSTTSTTMAPCATARCVLDAALGGAMCARERVPLAITRRIRHGEDLIDAAAARPGKAQRRLVRQAVKLLRRAGTDARKAPSARPSRLSAECAAAIRAATGLVGGSLTR